VRARYLPRSSASNRRRPACADSLRDVAAPGRACCIPRDRRRNDSRRVGSGRVLLALLAVGGDLLRRGRGVCTACSRRAPRQRRGARSDLCDWSTVRVDGALVVLVERTGDVAARGTANADLPCGGRRIRHACGRGRLARPACRGRGRVDRDCGVQPRRPGCERPSSGRPAVAAARSADRIRERAGRPLRDRPRCRSGARCHHEEARPGGPLRGLRGCSAHGARLDEQPRLRCGRLSLAR